jgi:tetratricopeptide (TPR) repeat protein
VRIYDLAARNLHDLGRYKQTARLLDQVIKIQKTLAKGHPFRLASHYGLARAYLVNGQVKHAVMLLKQIANIEKSLPKIMLVDWHLNRTLPVPISRIDKWRRLSCC